MKMLDSENVVFSKYYSKRDGLYVVITVRNAIANLLPKRVVLRKVYTRLYFVPFLSGLVVSQASTFLSKIQVYKDAESLLDYVGGYSILYDEEAQQYYIDLDRKIHVEENTTHKGGAHKKHEYPNGVKHASNTSPKVRETTQPHTPQENIYGYMERLKDANIDKEKAFEYLERYIKSNGKDVYKTHGEVLRDAIRFLFSETEVNEIIKTLEGGVLGAWMRMEDTRGE